ncbi:MAG: hypothetical protein Q9214_001551 [Letrouitia sp. 1 TL-2023]
MHLFSVTLLLSLSLISVADSRDGSPSAPIDVTVPIPDSNLLLHLVERRHLDLPKREYKSLITHVKTRIREAALSRDSGGWDAPFPGTEFEVVHEDIVYEFHGSPASLKLWPTYRVALRAANAVEENMWRLNYREALFSLHVKGADNFAAPTIATGSLYLGSFPGIG